MSSLPLQQGVQQIQHHGAVLTTIEGYAQLLKSAIKAQSGYNKHLYTVSYQNLMAQWM